MSWSWQKMWEWTGKKEMERQNDPHLESKLNKELAGHDRPKPYTVIDGKIRIPIEGLPDGSGIYQFNEQYFASDPADPKGIEISCPHAVGDHVRGVEEWGEYFHILGHKQEHGGYVYRGDFSKNVQDNINGEWQPAETDPEPRDYTVTAIEVEEFEIICAVDAPHTYQWLLTVEPKEKSE